LIESHTTALRDHTMKIQALLPYLVLLMFNVAAHAGPVGDMKSSLASMRQHTMAMMGESDRGVMEMQHEESMKYSDMLDKQLEAALKNKDLVKAQPTLKQVKSLWEELKKTRDGEIIPLLYAGDRLKARMTAMTTQQTRFKKLSELLDSLPQ
jgi:hypothetical protein